jgi:hypothetical protein
MFSLFISAPFRGKRFSRLLEKSALLLADGHFQPLHDLQHVMERLEMPISEKQRGFFK